MVSTVDLGMSNDPWSELTLQVGGMLESMKQDDMIPFIREWGITRYQLISILITGALRLRLGLPHQSCDIVSLGWVKTQPPGTDPSVGEPLTKPWKNAMNFVVMLLEEAEGVGRKQIEKQARAEGLTVEQCLARRMIGGIRERVGSVE
jgi:hypothetical protein